MDNFAKKQRATVQAAIDSGVLNNTNRSHELVDFVARLAADKGLTFDFANNEKLKESGFALEGVTVNGFVNANGVTVNIQSAKALNAVVGHEITHVLESTQLYDALAQSITEYAKAKGEYQSRYDSLAKLYAGVENANVEAEVVADLVGDYLFTDKAFVQKLSTENRNVFQKIFDEIKYLCKVVTAGSKEARQLLEVKKAFEEAYRAETKNTVVEDGAKYSLNIKHTDGTVEELADARNLTDEQAVSYLKQAQKGTLKRETYIPVRKDTPQVIIDTMAEAGENIGNRSLVMQVRKAQQSMTAAKSGRRGGKYGNNVRNHGLTPEQIVEIVNKLDNPTMAIHQTNRSDMNGNPLPNNVAFFVEYNKNGTESVAVIEFDSSIDPQFIGTEHGDTEFHTVVTVFEPDVERNGMDFDYAEELLSNPDNIELKIKRRQSTESATGTNQSNTSNELPSNNSIRNPGEDVNNKFSLSSAENVKAAEQHFGTTYKISEAGYLLTDGRLLDFSGKHEGGPGGYRTVDHRDITDALGDDYGDDTYSGGMIRFMGEGNIRLSPESGGINLSVKPNKAQLSTLDRYISNFRGEVILDIDDGNGNTVISVEYPKRTYSKRIINDINAYFDNGTIPEPPSSIGQFLSLSDQKKQEQNGADDPFPLPWQVRGRDVALEDIAPIGENAVTKQNAAPEGGLVSEEKVLAEGAGIRTQLRNNQTKLDTMPLVVEIQVPAEYAQMDIAGKKNWVVEKLRPTGYKVERKGFGIIDFAKKRLKSAFNYFDKNSVEETAFEALPYVLENGIEISGHNNHKDRNYETVTIAAPISINGKRGNMAVVVKQSDGNYYKVHRILTPDGSVFNLPEMTNEAESTPAGGVTENGSLATPKDSASTVSIPEQEAVVNPDDSTGAAPSPNMSYSLCFWYYTMRKPATGKNSRGGLMLLSCYGARRGRALARFVCICARECTQIMVSPGPYPASNSPPDCCI